MKQLSRKSSIQELDQKMKDKNLFPRDKGQKMKINILVGEKLPSYSSTIDINIIKQLAKEALNKSN